MSEQHGSNLMVDRCPYFVTDCIIFFQIRFSMNCKSKYAVRSFIKSLDRIGYHLDTLKTNPNDFDELNNFLIESKLFARFNYLSQFKEALKQSIGQNW
jgi:hypothetical protein